MCPSSLRCAVRTLFVAVTTLAGLSPSLAAPGTDEPIDMSRQFVFGAVSKDLLTHPDDKLREVARMVELNAEPQKPCVERWFKLPEPDSYFGLWEPAGFAHDMVEGCRRGGGTPLHVRPTGNDTSVFSVPVVLCLPPECDASFVRQFWLPRVFFGRMVMMPDRKQSLSLATLRRAMDVARVSVEKLVTFPRPDLPMARLVIAGFPFSGTTSLVTELKRHPQIAIPHHEDQMYWSFLFTRRSVDKWKTPYARKEAKKQKAFPANKSVSIINGLKDPFLALSTDGMKAVARVPGVKVIIMLRDPMHIIQTWINHGAEWINPFGDMMGYYVGLQYRDIFFNVMRVIPPENLLVVPTIGLKRAPRLVYKRIMQFLGLPEATKRPFAVRENRFEDSASACAAIGRCFDWCKAPWGLPAGVHALLNMDATAGEALLRRHGWPPELVDMFRPLPQRCPAWQTLPGSKPHWAEANPGLCYAMHFEASECFESREDCSSCCEKHSTCKMYGMRFTECCVPLEKALIYHLRSLTRQVLCGSKRTTKWPCNKGFGRHLTGRVP